MALAHVWPWLLLATCQQSIGTSYSARRPSGTEAHKGLGPTVAKAFGYGFEKTIISIWVPSMPLLDATAQTTATLPWQDAVLVLTRLGYKRTQAEKVVQSHIADANDLDHLIRLALKSMAKETVGVS